MPGILKIVVFNNLYIPNVNKIRGVLGGDIVFCSAEKVHDDNSFIYAPNIDQGKLSYECTLKAMQKYPNKSGYLTLGDDILLCTSCLSNFDSNKMWIEGGEDEFHFSTKEPNAQ